MTARHRSRAPTTTTVGEQYQHPATSSGNHPQHARTLSHKHLPPTLRPNRPLAAWGRGWPSTSTHGDERPVATYAQHGMCWLHIESSQPMMTAHGPFHHNHQHTALSAHQHPCMPTRVGYMTSPHHQRGALPPQPSTHSNMRPPAPMYAQQELRWLHIKSPPPTMRPSTKDIHSWQHSTLGCKLSPHHQRRMDPAA